MPGADRRVCLATEITGNHLKTAGVAAGTEHKILVMVPPKLILPKSIPRNLITDEHQQKSTVRI